jgi:sugar phosphate isomerase/epimerase
MNKIKGPGIFLAQFLRDDPPFNNIDGIIPWAAKFGYKGVQIPTWDKRIFDLETASGSKAYCDAYKGPLAEWQVELIELASYLQGQVLAMHPAYADMFQPFYPDGLSLVQCRDWAMDQLKKTVLASAKCGTSNISVMSGGFAWHMVYPWPQRPEGIIDEAFTELAKRWRPILDLAGENGISIGFELHPGSDLFDGSTFDMFLEKVDDHPAACITYDPSHFVLQQLDYLEFIEIYYERIKAFHVKDAEFNPNGRTGVYGGYQPWIKRAGRFRSLGDGQVDFKRIFSILTEKGFNGWAILEWECCLKSPGAGAAEGAPFISRHIIETTDIAFDDFAGGKTDHKRNRRILGFDD